MLIIQIPVRQQLKKVLVSCKIFVYTFNRHSNVVFLCFSTRKKIVIFSIIGIVALIIIVILIIMIIRLGKSSTSNETNQFIHYFADQISTIIDYA